MEKNREWIDIKQLRREHGLLQREAAEKLGITRAYLSSIENGQRGISKNVMRELICVFGVEYEDFFKSVRA